MGTHCVRSDVWPTTSHQACMHKSPVNTDFTSILRSECGGTRWRTGREVKGKLANGVGTLTRPRNVAYSALLTLMRTPRLPAVDWADSPADLNGLIRLGERRNVVSAHVPSGSARALLTDYRPLKREIVVRFSAGIRGCFNSPDCLARHWGPSSLLWNEHRGWFSPT